MKIKICGIREFCHAQVAAAAGADFLGFVFADSKRRVLPEKAKEIIDTARATDFFERARFVGVFVNENPDAVNGMAAYCGLDLVQLSGDETGEDCAKIVYPIIKAVRPRSKDESAKALSYAGFCESLLFDAYHLGSYGGSGITGNWQLASEAARKTKLLLAGGLTPENVVAAIKAVSPWGVDVSSGVETEGVKDEGKILDFIRAVRSRNED